MDKSELTACSFCDTPPEEIENLIRCEGVAVCYDCVESMAESIAEYRLKMTILDVLLNMRDAEQMIDANGVDGALEEEFVTD